MSKTYHADERGYYGEFGGSFVPEMLYPNMVELQERYLEIMNDPEFVKEFNQLLKAGGDDETCRSSRSIGEARR